MEFRQYVIQKKNIPQRVGRYAEFPEGLNPGIVDFLHSKGIEKLYIHQAETFSVATEGKSVVITTSTASGKTLSFLLPVLQAILEDPLTRAIFVYPTKALASDQFRVVKEILAFFGEDTLSAGVYDGDTQPAERSRIRKSANIILTNPEMLNTAFLPNHSRYGFDFIFSNLKYVVVDELHSYRGAFGAHLANLFRRMKRICDFYKSAPVFLCSSATIANPGELGKNITGHEVALVHEDGSPAPSKDYYILQPPVIKGINDIEFGRKSAISLAAELLPQLVEDERHFIAFGKSRRSVEVLLTESRDRLNSAGFLHKGNGEQIAGYRGGYTPRERKAIEQNMISGKLFGLISTNALELGIDIGTLDTTVLVGYPGTRASFWQQTGRAGRSGTECSNYLILDNQTFDQYIGIDPDWLFEKESESAIVDPDNLLIQLSHIRAAAAEIPLSLDDIALFPDLGEVIPVLLNAEEVKSRNGRFDWDGPAFPAGDFSLRNMDQSRYKLVLEENGKEITEMDETQAFHEIYPGAIYIHEGNQYEITRLDLVTRTAVGRPFEGNFYTVPAGESNVSIIQTLHEQKIGLSELKFGDIEESEVVTMFKKLQFHNHQNLGYVTLTQPLSKKITTESTWISMPQEVVEIYRKLVSHSPQNGMVKYNHFEGVMHAIKSAAMMVTMSAPSDIDAAMSSNALVPDGNPEEVISLFLYDRYEGGLGYSEKIYDKMDAVLKQAISLVKGCGCETGCPACVGDYHLDKKLVLWGLESILKEQQAPADYAKIVKEADKTYVKKNFSFFELEQKWEMFLQEIESNGDRGAAFLKTARRVQVEGHTLRLVLDSEFVGKWFSEPENYRMIMNTLRYHAVTPGDAKIEISVEADETDAKRKREKLVRQYTKDDNE